MNKQYNAYYYTFEGTGCVEVDDILRLFADVGKCFHYTEDWRDKLDHLGGKSYIEAIQLQAVASAAVVKNLQGENKRLKEEVESLNAEVERLHTLLEAGY